MKAKIVRKAFCERSGADRQTHAPDCTTLRVLTRGRQCRVTVEPLRTLTPVRRILHCRKPQCQTFVQNQPNHPRVSHCCHCEMFQTRPILPVFSPFDEIFEEKNCWFVWTWKNVRSWQCWALSQLWCFRENVSCFSEEMTGSGFVGANRPVHCVYFQ